MKLQGYLATVLKCCEDLIDECDGNLHERWRKKSTLVIPLARFEYLST